MHMYTVTIPKPIQVNLSCLPFISVYGTEGLARFLQDLYHPTLLGVGDDMDWCITYN